MSKGHIIAARIRDITVRQEGNRVILIEDGKAILDVPWQYADKIAKAMRSKARAAEEQDKAPAIAMDAAIVLRAGLPFGLSSDPKIMAESRKLAAHDRDLRRYMPGGIKSQQQFGQPAVTVHKPTRRLRVIP
jgi:hypothetical protein